jgi:hypothetical protein
VLVRVPHKNGVEPLRKIEPLNGVMFTLPRNKMLNLVELLIHMWKRCSLPRGALFIGRVADASVLDVHLLITALVIGTS